MKLAVPTPLEYFASLVHSDEGFPLPAAARQAFGFDLTQPGPRYLAALALFAHG